MTKRNERDGDKDGDGDGADGGSRYSRDSSTGFISPIQVSGRQTRLPFFKSG